MTQTTTTGGNAINTLFSVEERFAENLQKEVDKKQRELQRNKGFFDIVNCPNDGSNYNPQPGSNERTYNVGGQNCQITSPGSIVNEQLNQALASDGRRLELADEINEVFAALVGQLIKTVFSKSGVTGLSSRSSGSRSVIDQYAESTNTAATIGSRDDFLIFMSNYQTTVAEHIGFKQQAIGHLFQARDAILETLICYHSKYNTWVRNSDGTYIAPEDVEDIPVSERTRATFFKTIQLGQTGGDGQPILTTVYLTPAVIESKAVAYQELLATVEDYIFSMNAEIGIAEQDIDSAQLLAIQVGVINDADNPLAAALASSTILTRIAAQFQGADNLVSVALDDGTFIEIPQEISNEQILQVYAVASEELAQYNNEAALQQVTIIQAAVDDMLNGIPTSTGQRLPGVLSDLEECRSFSSVFQPGSGGQATQPIIGDER